MPKTKLREIKIKDQWGDVVTKFKYNPQVTETFDGKIKLGQDCSYRIGSDRYKMQVKHISNTGKSFINVEGKVFRAKESSRRPGEFYWVHNKHFFFDERKDSYWDPSF